VEDTSQQVDSGIAARMDCIRMNIMWKILHSKWTVVLQLEWRVLEWTLCGRYFTAGGQCYCSLNGVYYSKHYVEDTSQHVDCGIAAWMACVRVNIMWKIFHSMWTVVLQLEWSVLQWTIRGKLHSMWTVLLQLECSVLQWTLFGRYFNAGGHWHCNLNGVCFSEHYV